MTFYIVLVIFVHGYKTLSVFVTVITDSEFFIQPTGGEMVNLCIGILLFAIILTTLVGIVSLGLSGEEGNDEKVSRLGRE